MCTTLNIKNSVHVRHLPLFCYFTDSLFLGQGNKSPPGMNPAHPLSALEMTRLALFKMYNQAGLPPTGPPGGPPGGPLGAAAGLNQANQALEMGRAMVEHQARALQAAQREAEAREKDLQASKSPLSLGDKSINKDSDSTSKRSKESSEKSRHEEDDDLSPPPMKRERQDSLDHRNGSPVGLGAHIRIANRGNFYSTTPFEKSYFCPKIQF